jgi:hypothetical protein
VVVGKKNPALDYRIGTLIQPLAKPMAKMTKGVDMPNMII